MTQTRNEIDGDSAGIAHLTDSDRHQLLTADRRRIAIEVLADRSGPTSLEELASAVATRETGTEVADSTDVERAAIALHHNHLPRMAEHGVVDYHAETRQVH